MMRPNVIIGMGLTGFIVIFVIFVCLVLATFIVWQWVRTSGELRDHEVEHTLRPQNTYRNYEEGYHQPEAYQEAEEQPLQSSSQPEQPQAQYPQELPLQH